ncbi:hypothetical protein RND71_013850 [Anisodus tanguticus]|uniref:Uncharacterized protein n=1 Tax=Anisodus tanguticus TaxID=243964 RepID=A0AAE1S9M0_9SOLA|nr:hypothetical protein RND71_013850 [Anisodus tanguticus]
MAEPLLDAEKGFPEEAGADELLDERSHTELRGRSTSKDILKAADWASETLGQTSDVVSDEGQLNDTSKVAVLQQRKLIDDKERSSMLKPSVQSPPRSPQKSTLSAVQSKANLKISVTSDPISVKSSSSDSPKLTDKSAPEVISAETSVMLKADPHKTVVLKALKKPFPWPAPITAEKSPSKQVTTSATAERPISRQVPAQSRPLSAPLVTGPKPAAPVFSMVQATQLLPRSVGAAGRLGPDPSPATNSYVPQSYRNAIMGGPVSGSPAGFSQPHLQVQPLTRHIHTLQHLHRLLA